MALSTDAAQRITKEVRDRHQSMITRLTEDTTRTEEYRLGLLAREYFAMVAERDAAVAEHEARTAGDRRYAERKAFGVDDLTGDPASLVISRRDAADRASRLRSADEALELLDSADRIGDEVLARAVAHQSHAHGWRWVVDKFVESRPKLAANIAELRRREPSLQDQLVAQMTLDTLRPEALRGKSDYQLRQLESAVAKVPAQ